MRSRLCAALTVLSLLLLSPTATSSATTVASWTRNPVAETNVYGKQAFTAGTFSYSSPTTSDGNYPEAIYFEKAETVNSVGPNGERILDAVGGDYGASALTIYNFATLGADANYVDFWNGGDGIYLEIDAQFSSVAEADLVTLAAIMSMGNRRASPESFRKNFGLDLNFSSGELEITTKGDGTVGFGTYTADDLWYTLRVYLLPSSDNGTTDDGIVRVWKKLSTDPDSSFTLEYENAASFLWSSPFVGAPTNGQNYVNIGRYGILPSTNFRIFIVTEDTQSWIWGKDGDVSSTLTAAWFLGGTGDHTEATGDGPISLPNTFYIDGDLVVTGDISGSLVAGSASLDDLSDVTITTPAAGDLLRYSGSAWVNTGATGAVQWAEVAASSSDLLALRATPKTLVAAPGAGKLLEFCGAVLLLDATATAYVESAANLSIKYTDGSGTKVSEDIEATGFIDQTADTMTTARPKLDAIVAKSGCENQALVLHNIGAGEYTTGTGVVRAKVAYRVWSTGW